MSKRLNAKAAEIMAPTATSATASPAPSTALSVSRPKTAPGSMLHFMNNQSAVVKEAEELRQRVPQTLDPRLIQQSRWANRHESHYLTQEFRSLKAEIAAAGGNTVPIKVRPIRNTVGEGVGPSNPSALRFEIVYGHRRHRACAELGLPVLALIEELTEQSLFVEMELENREREDLSPWEKGMVIARALDEGLYASNRQLATAIRRDLGDVGKMLSLARLPRAVVDAFPSPLALQFRWAKPLSDAQQADPEGLLARAKAAKERAGQLSAKQVFEMLTAAGKGVGRSNPDPVVIGRNGKRLGTLKADARGRAIISVEAGVLAAERHDALVKLLEDFLAG